MTATRNESRQIKTASGQFDILKNECIKVADEEKKIADSAKSFVLEDDTISMEPVVETPTVDEEVTSVVEEPVSVDGTVEMPVADEKPVTDNSFEVSDTPQETTNGFNDITNNPFEVPVYDTPEEPVTPVYEEPTIEQPVVSEEPVVEETTVEQPVEIDWKDLTQFESYDEYFTSYVKEFGTLPENERPKFFGEKKDFEREKKVQLNKIENKKLKKEFEEQVKVIEDEYADKFAESNSKHAEELEKITADKDSVIADKDSQISDLTDKLAKSVSEVEQYKVQLTDALKKNVKAVKYISGLKDKEKEFSESAGLDVVTKLQDIAKDLEKFDVAKISSKSSKEIEKKINSLVYGEVTEEPVEENTQDFTVSEPEVSVSEPIIETSEESTPVVDDVTTEEVTPMVEENVPTEVTAEMPVVEETPTVEEPTVETSENEVNPLIGEIDDMANLISVPIDEPEVTEIQKHR